MRKTGFLILCVLAIASTAFTEEKTPDGGQFDIAKFEAGLNYKKGDITLPGDIATLVVTDSFRYLDPADSKRLLEEGWGNPDGGDTLGMLVPSEISPLSKEGWAVVITYEEDGYVSDKDANSIDYTELLKDMKEQVTESNKERQKQGYETIELIGWAEKPHYDNTTHKLYWAKELSFGGSIDHTLNYNIRILGRKGVLNLNAVSGMKQIEAISKDMQNVIAFTEFNKGYRYEDFQPGTDKMATYGIAALVAGGVAAKAGLFSKLFAVILAAKKAIIAIVIAVGAFLVNLFKRKKEN